MAFETFMRLLQELDPVRAGGINTPLRQIDQNVRYLWQILQAASIGSTVYAHQQVIEPTVKVGMPVYFNKSTQRFEKAMAAANTSAGVIETAESAQVWGVVAEKLNTNLADILLYGIDIIPLAESVDGPPIPGVYYLSGGTPGKLVKQKPPVTVAVLRYMPDGRVFVMPQFVDLLDRHTHYRFELECSPAGETTPPNPGDRHVITAPNPAIPGWLPAAHAVFEGHAPPGAVFGYNLDADPVLLNSWPPIPFGNAYLEIDRATDATVGGTGVPLGKGGLCVIDNYGLWWMSDCYGDVPWPTLLDTANPVSYSEPGGAECPRHLVMALILWFSKVNFATDQTAVLSLHSGDGLISVRCYGTPDEATTGHLELFLNLNLTVSDDTPGYVAIKEFDRETSQFKRGPLVEGFYAQGENVLLTGSVHAVRDVGGQPRDVFQGLVGVAVQPRDSLELDVQLVRLQGVEEQFLQDFMYLGFVEDEQREYRAKLHVPSDLDLTGPHLKLRFQILGRLAGTLPPLEMTGRILPRPAGLTPADLPQDVEEFTITCNTQALLADNNQYVEVESEPFPVAAGDTLFFTVRRMADDGYGAEVGILRQAGVVSAVV